jgi:DNA-directed RNA polymerase specialized sigma24 family protein
MATRQGGGDEEGFDVLIRAVEPRLARAFAAAYGRGRGEEALGEALAYAWEHRAQVLAMANPGGFLYRVGQSRSRPRKEVRAFPEPAGVGVPEVEPLLPTAFAELSERQRECVGLVVADGCSYQEAADLLGITKASVQVHVRRGVESLRQRLGVEA